MINHKFEWILLLANKKKTKFMLKGTRDESIRLPIEYLHAMGWESGNDVIISNAFWDSSNQCHKIQIELAVKPQKKGRWAK